MSESSAHYGSVGGGPLAGLPSSEVVSALATSIAAHESEQSGSISANSETALINDAVSKLATMAAESQIEAGDGTVDGGPPPEQIMQMATDVASALQATGQSPAQMEQLKQQTEAYIKQLSPHCIGLDTSHHCGLMLPGLHFRLQAEGKLPEDLPPEVMQALPIIQAQNETIRAISIFGTQSRQTSQDLRSKRLINGLLHGFLFLILIVLGAIESANSAGMCAIVAGLLMLVALIATSLAVEEPLELMDGLGELEKLSVLQVTEEEVRDIMENGMRSRKILMVRDTLDIESTQKMIDYFRRTKKSLMDDGPAIVKKMMMGNTVIWFISSVITIAGSAASGLSTASQILILVIGLLLLFGAGALIAGSVIAVKTVNKAFEEALNSGLLHQLEEYDGKVEELMNKVIKPLLDGDFDFVETGVNNQVPPSKMTDQLLNSP